MTSNEKTPNRTKHLMEKSRLEQEVEDKNTSTGIKRQKVKKTPTRNNVGCKKKSTRTKHWKIKMSTGNNVEWKNPAKTKVRTNGKCRIYVLENLIVFKLLKRRIPLRFEFLY
jgi:hypothetical protein